MIKFKLKDLFYTYTSTLIVMGTSFLVMLSINNKLGVEAYGKFTFFMAITSFFSLLFSVRSGEAVINILAKEKIPESSLIPIAAMFDVIIFLINVFFMFIAGYVYIYISEGLGSKDLILFLFLGVSSALPILTGVPNGSILFKEKYVFLSYIRVLTPLIRSLLIIFYFLTSFTLENVAVSFLFSSLFGVTCFWFFFLKENKTTFILPRIKDCKIYFKLALTIYLSLFFKSGLTNVDTIILGSIVSNEKLGAYQTLKLILQPVNFIATPLGKIIYPKFAKNIKNGIKNILKSIYFYSSILIMVGVFSLLMILVFKDSFFIITKVDVSENKLVVLFFFFQILSLSIGDWWFRAFSNSVNPRYSLNAAIFSLIYIWVIVFLTTKYFELEGFVFSMLVLFILKCSYFWYTFNLNYKRSL